MSKTKRIQWIDLIRAIAILTVLYCHSIDGIYILQMDAATSVSLASRIFEFFSLFIGRLGVPFFLMISGYLLLDRAYDDEKVRKFWNNNVKDLIICTVVWCVIYVLFLVVTMGPGQLTDVEGCMLLFSHMWYMPMIIGMYLSLPFVTAALKAFSRQTIYQATIVFTILAFCVPFIASLLSLSGVDGTLLNLCLGFSGGIYGIYMILGYLVKKGQFKDVTWYKLLIIAFVCLLITVFFEYYTYTHGINFNLWYEFPFLMLAAFCLFELISRKDSVRGYRLVQFLSKYSFAVFLIHNLFRLPLLIIVLIFFTAPEPILALILWVLLTVVSFAAAALVYRIPRFGKFILYMK